MKIYHALFLIVGLFFSACEAGLRGDFSENQPPNTFLTTNEINRNDEDRFSSQISISWWGDDPDGFVVAYEVAINDTSLGWIRTEKTDSVFVLPIPEGNLEADVSFIVRAIDNLGGKDETPATLIFPIQNSLPVVTINPSETPPAETFHVVAFGWSLLDLDGPENIQTTEIAVNDTVNGWVEIPYVEQFVTLIATNINGEDADANVYFGPRLRDSEFVVSGLKLNNNNTFYVRARDKTLSTGAFDSVSWFMKAQTSKILLLNDVEAGPSRVRVDQTIALMADLGLDKIDVLNINDQSAVLGQKVPYTNNLPKLVTSNFEESFVPRRMLAQWDHIYWVSDDIDRNITYAQQITSEFFNNGGTMFATIPMKGIQEEDQIFNFLPVDSVGKLPALATNFQISRNSQVVPIANESWPTLTSDRIISTVYPMKPGAGAVELYRGNYSLATVLGTRTYDGFEATAIKNAEQNLIYFGMDFMLINNGTNNISGLLEAMLINELGFQDE